MNDATPAGYAPKPKKSVALSGVIAGNTALCSVGRSGNDLHYRGYDILDIATTCEFEEIAYLLVHEKLPNRAELAAYKAKWGAQERILYRYYSPQIGAENPHSSMLSGRRRLLEKVWRKLPLHVTARLGDLIYSYL